MMVRRVHRRGVVSPVRPIVTSRIIADRIYSVPLAHVCPARSEIVCRPLAVEFFFLELLRLSTLAPREWRRGHPPTSLFEGVLLHEDVSTASTGVFTFSGAASA